MGIAAPAAVPSRSSFTGFEIMLIIGVAAQQRNRTTRTASTTIKGIPTISGMDAPFNKDLFRPQQDAAALPAR